jgi:iron complex outermembrane receptor protein
MSRMPMTISPRKLCAVWLLLLTLVQTAGAAVEQDDPTALKNLSLEDLSKIEVTTVSKEATAAFSIPAAIYVITRDEIRRSGATNIPDLLRLVPGVEVAQIDSAKWSVGIRGFQGRLSKSVLVLIDGRSVYTPLFAGVYWEMQDTLLADIDRIEVIRGPGGTIWGANAVNGVINIITKSAMETRGTLVSTRAGTVEQGGLDVRYGAGDNRFAYRVFGRGFTRGPQYHRDGRNFDDWRRAGGGFRMDWIPNSFDSLTVVGGAYGMEAGSKLAISTFSPPALSNLEANGRFSGQHLEMGWRRKLRSGSDIQVRGFFDRTDRADLNYREVRNTFDVDFLHHIPADGHEVMWGAGIRVSPSRFFQTVPSVDFQPHEQTYSIYSAFAQDSIALIPNRLTATLGTKLEHNTFSGFEFQPSGRLAWTPTEQQTVWAAVTRAVRTPSRIEDSFAFSFLAQPAVPLYLRLIGDGQFTPEQLVGYEIGYRAYIQDGGFLGLSTFYNRYDDLLSVESRPPFVEESPAPTHLVLPLYFRNGVAAQTKGFEISSLWDVRTWWRLAGSYSFVQINAERYAASNDASTVAQLEGDTPRHKVVVRQMFTLPGAFDLDLTYRYVSRVFGPDQRVPSYSTGDVRIARRLTRELEFSIVGQNLLQPRHPEYAGNPGGLVDIRKVRLFHVDVDSMSGRAG